MEWFVIYLFVMIERLAAVLALGWGAFWIGFFALGICFFAAALTAIDNQCTTAEQMKQPGFKTIGKFAKWSMIIGLILGILTYFIPTQKDLAIIVGSGVTYKAVTSETGQRIGGKAIDFLEKKLDDALTDTPTPEAPKQTTPATKGQAGGKGTAL